MGELRGWRKLDITSLGPFKKTGSLSGCEPLAVQTHEGATRWPRRKVGAKEPSLCPSFPLWHLWGRWGQRESHWGAEEGSEEGVRCLGGWLGSWRSPVVIPSLPLGGEGLVSTLVEKVVPMQWFKWLSDPGLFFKLRSNSRNVKLTLLRYIN